MNSTQPGNAGRILIVDDEKDITNLFADLMRDMGYEVRAADDGEVALQIIGSYRPDIVVSDIHMPRIDGDE
ncbi:MAG: response regulator, partial [Bacteroidetes bacterium]|nr:response regulator [Bacteroidota bacterium]